MIEADAPPGHVWMHASFRDEFDNLQGVLFTAPHGATDSEMRSAASRTYADIYAKKYAAAKQ